MQLYFFEPLILIFLVIFATCQHVRSRQCGAHDVELEADFDSVSTYPNFNFWASWTRDGKHFWTSEDFDFEQRYLNNENSSKPHVEVFVVPFSHNDPGWKMTFEGYFHNLTKYILNNAMEKLPIHTNMTFVWSEICFLSKWWDGASFTEKETLKSLIKDGRFEILTGGWVMPDEATSSLFGLTNQLIEGNQWVHQNLKIAPTYAWSIDPFGHGSTMPFLLKKSGFRGMMIQRLHYAWKHWFAEHRKGDFIWVPRWSHDLERDGIVCHNAHYDLYPTKHSCGPSAITCMKFDFRDIVGMHEEQRYYNQPVTKGNVAELSEVLVDQYRRTASLTTHNKVLTSLGGDFRFDELLEWDQQYENYMKLNDHVNSRKTQFRTSVKFGKLQDYFKAVDQTNVTLPVFKGDFLPYRNEIFMNDIIFGFSPAYWTGFYGTRPFWKKLSREAEDELFKAEILFTLTYNLMRQRGYSSLSLFRNYDNLVYARRAVALFQHHDAITGTSPRTTAVDYAKKLTRSWTFAQHIQKIAIENLLERELSINMPLLESYKIRRSLEMPRIVPTKLYSRSFIVKKVVIFNSLAWKRSHLVKLTVEDSKVIVRGPHRENVISQVNIIPAILGGAQRYELLFVAELPPLSLVTYEVSQQMGNRDLKYAAVVAEMSCRNYDKHLRLEPLEDNEIRLDNGILTAKFDNVTGQLTHFKDKRINNVGVNASITFGKYGADIGSGAYLLRPSISSYESLPETSHSRQSALFVIEGPVASEVSYISKTLNFSTWVVNTGDVEIMSAIYMSNTLNVSDYGEYFMRVQTDMNNTEENSFHKSESNQKRRNAWPVFFTDTNGLGVEKRVYMNELPYEANHYPVTNYAFFQDSRKNIRLNLVVDRAHGMSSPRKGRLELIIDRRLPFDDGRGMDEGVFDSEVVTNRYALRLESFTPKEGNDPKNFKNWEASLEIQRLAKYLNHDPSIFFYNALVHSKSGRIDFLSGEMPRYVHLLNLRTLSRPLGGTKNLPSNRALMVLQRFGYKDADCEGGKDPILNSTLSFLYHHLRETNLVGTMSPNLKGSNGLNRSYNNYFPRLPMNNINPGKKYELSAYNIHF